MDDFRVYQVAPYGRRYEIITIYGFMQLVDYLNNKYFNCGMPFSDKYISKILFDINSLDSNSFYSNLKYSFDLWRIL